LDSGFQSLAGFRIPNPRILDSKTEKFVDSGIGIPLHEEKINKIALEIIAHMKHTYSILLNQPAEVL